MRGKTRRWLQDAEEKMNAAGQKSPESGEDSGV